MAIKLQRSMLTLHTGSDDGPRLTTTSGDSGMESHDPEEVAGRTPAPDIARAKVCRDKRQWDNN